MRLPPHHDARGRRRGGDRHPHRRRRLVPLGRALRPRGDPVGVGAAAALQPQPARGRHRASVDDRPRRRADGARLPRGDARPDPGVPRAGACRRRDAALHRRRPLDGAGGAAGGGREARPARARAPRRPRRRVGVLLRRALLPRHGVQAGGRGGPGRPVRLGAGGHARHALRRRRRARARPAGLRLHPVGGARRDDAGRVREPRPRPRRRPPGLPQLRHRLRRPRVRARHGHPRGGRPLERAGARLSARADRDRLPRARLRRGRAGLRPGRRHHLVAGGDGLPEMLSLLRAGERSSGSGLQAVTTIRGPWPTCS